MKPTTDFTTRFWSKVRKDATGCWIWTASTAGSGFRYGQVSWRARYRTPQKAHRVAWEITNGSIPDNLFVLHRCDTPLCVNPNHLFLGTQSDNLADASQKGRLTVPRARKLTLDERLAIYFAPRDKATGGELARRYGVSKVAIHHIRYGRFIGAPLERVSHVLVPVRGDLHVGQSLAFTAEPSRSLSDGGVR